MNLRIGKLIELKSKSLMQILISMLLAVLAPMVFADVYKCPGSGGSITLSNVEKGGSCVKMNLPPLPVKKSQPSTNQPAVAPSSIADSTKKKSNLTYDAAQSERKRIILDEIDLEKNRLSTVQTRIKELANQMPKTPDQVKEMMDLQQKEAMHKSNIQLLQKELNK